MSLKLMYITNRPDVAEIAEAAGVDRIFIDMEYIGKELRQKGMNTVQLHHTIEDIVRIREAIKRAELLVRCNPIHDETEEYDSSEEEINEIIKSGADVIMLPYFKTLKEVHRFLAAVNGRAKTMLLLETPEAVSVLDEILEVPGIDEIHIGLNDLSLGYGMRFLFEPLADGTVDMLAKKFRQKGIPFGFGGVASLGKGLLSAEHIIMEHYRLGSNGVILSRSFCNLAKIDDIEQIRQIFTRGVGDIRKFEDECSRCPEMLEANRERVSEIVRQIVGSGAV
ncbi:MAG: aldolase [Ruminococcaceae bacterium]|nr:aldolase [Oscillospiraceae bacterium]